MWKEKFNENEWAALREAPNWVALGMTFAGASGFFGTMGETVAGLRSITEVTGSSLLIQELGTKEELTASRESIQAALKEERPEDPREYLKSTAVMKAQQSLAILRGKAPEELTNYRAWLIDIADSVANSSREGGFLGFGGERVSEGERAFKAHLLETID